MKQAIHMGHTTGTPDVALNHLHQVCETKNSFCRAAFFLITCRWKARCLSHKPKALAVHPYEVHRYLVGRSCLILQKIAAELADTPDRRPLLSTTGLLHLEGAPASKTRSLRASEDTGQKSRAKHLPFDENAAVAFSAFAETFAKRCIGQHCHSVAACGLQAPRQP